jgi:hypothetical protein
MFSWLQGSVVKDHNDCNEKLMELPATTLLDNFGIPAFTSRTVTLLACAAKRYNYLSNN